MFEAARWRLAAWYAGVLVLMIAAFGGGLYAWTNRSLLAENDAQLAEAVRLMIPRLAGERRPLGGGGHRQGLERERGDGVRASEEDEQKAGAEAGEQAERLRGDLEEIEGRLIPDGDDWARLPVALAVLDARRRVVVRMPSPGPSWFPDPGLAETAQRLGTPAIATLRRGGVAVRVLAAPVPRPDGVWVVQAAKSIAETDAALRRLRQV
ncbi:MAG: hypothetical protein IRY95_03700, partial [Clostridia bacterium]|nr:hypothetical protein [Clostridia bacterium]